MIYLTKNQNQKKSTIDVFKSGKNVSANWIIFRRIIIITKKKSSGRGAILLLHSIQQFIIALFFNIFFFGYVRQVCTLWSQKAMQYVSSIENLSKTKHLSFCAFRKDLATFLYTTFSAKVLTFVCLLFLLISTQFSSQCNWITTYMTSCNF